MIIFKTEADKKFIFLMFFLSIFMFTVCFLFCHLKKSNTQIVTPNQLTIDIKKIKNNIEPKITEKKYILKKGDTIIKLLSDYISTAEIYKLIKNTRKKFNFRNLKAGHSFIYVFQDNHFIGFEYYKDKSKKICIKIKDGIFVVEEKNIPYKIKKHIVQGTIKTSLFEAIEKAGEHSNLAISLAEIFAWDIDFVHDIRAGDSFKIIVEKNFLDNKFAGYGKILAAQIKNRNKVFEAYWYKTTKGETGYYDINGLPLEKVFLKAPLKFTYISSKYSMRRFHPILKVIKPHQGVDFAAPIGTPIKSVADGVIIRKGYDKEGGNFIKIRHKNGYVTIYNHMSKFAKGIRVGKPVKQAEVIGYVGMTGLATGPHLDFRVIKNGRFINPLKLPSIPKRPLSSSEKRIFLAKIKPLVGILHSKMIARINGEYTNGKIGN